MFGSWIVEVKEVRPFTIHGDQYFEYHVVRVEEADGPLIGLKVPLHAVKAGTPNPGDRVSVTFLAGQVTSTRPVAK